MPMHTNDEAQTIARAYRHLYFMVDHTYLTHDLDDALKAARAMGSSSSPATIREREAGVIGGFLAGFQSPRKFTAAGMHGLCRWWQIAVMAGARFRTDDHKRTSELATSEPRWFEDTGPVRAKEQLRSAAKARRMMRDALEANRTARDRWLATR